MPYQVDLSLKPHELVRGLVNHDNDMSLTVDQLTINRDPIILDEASGFNTELSVTVSTGVFPDVVIRDALISLNRMDLAVMFSTVNVYLREVDIFDDQGAIIRTAVHSEMMRKYGWYTDDLNFNIAEDATGWYIEAKPECPAYIGRTYFEIEDSLKTRVPNTVLDGFVALPPTDLRFNMVINEISLLTEQTADYDGRAQAERLTYAIDFTHVSNYLTLNPDNTLVDPSYLETELAKYAITGVPATTTYILYDTTSYDGSNEAYTKVLVSSPLDLPEVEGSLLIHYNDI